MSAGPLHVASIVEGDGEVSSVPILIRRIVTEFAPGTPVQALKPIRQPRSRLIGNIRSCLSNSLGYARKKLAQIESPGCRPLILILLDADNDCAARLGPELLALARSQQATSEICCVLAVLEFETWFVAAAESLRRYLRIDAPTDIPADPESMGCRKAWIQQLFRGTKYSETVDQPKLTSAMDVALCRSRAPSFDKLCREILTRCQAAGAT